MMLSFSVKSVDLTLIIFSKKLGFADTEARENFTIDHSKVRVVCR